MVWIAEMRKYKQNIIYILCCLKGWVNIANVRSREGK